MSRFGSVLRVARGHRSKLVVPRRTLSYPNDPLTQAIDVATPRDPAATQRLAQCASGPHSSETQVTTLENGLRVASQEAFGQYSTVGGEPRSKPGECALIRVLYQRSWTQGRGMR